MRRTPVSHPSRADPSLARPSCVSSRPRACRDHRLARRTIALACLAVLAAGGCGAPVRVKRAAPERVLRDLTRSVLTTGEPSLPSENVLHRWNLTERYHADPEGTLATLREQVIAGRGGPNEIFALAELSFHHAEHAPRLQRQPYYLAAALYAYALLFPDGGDEPPGALDPRSRVASDIYNRAVVEGFASHDGKRVEFRAGAYVLPFGQLEIALDPAMQRWAGRELADLTPVADLEIQGFRARYRRSGIGAPLAAKAWATKDAPDIDRYLAPRARIPVTAVLRLPDARRQLLTPSVHGSVELYSGWDTVTVQLDGRTVPLEVEPTAVLAYFLADSPVWSWELKGFLFGDLLGRQSSRLVFLQPHRSGRIPVVFVHGTASSPGRWADMVNDLMSDRYVRDRFEFWFFAYSTANPIPYSAMLLRDSLQQAVERLDPGGFDPALRQMVVIGHSQGGLLTKMTAIDSGDQLWRAFSRRPLAELNVSDETRDLLRRGLFVTPLPFVRRVIFMATPHHGSYVAAWSISQLVQRLVSFPVDLLGATGDLLRLNADALLLDPEHPRIGAVYGMSPGSPLIKALAPIPIAPEVPAHSIIAVQGNGPLGDGGDGVVRYASAHIDGVASELVVRSAHSCQSQPDATEEVRRILHLHAAAACETGGLACAVPPPASPAQPAGEPR